MLTTPIILIVTALLAGLMLRPHIMAKKPWRAMVTPLASIIGSGFLVVGPLLVHIAGSYALVIMIGLCGAGYLFGAAVRTNIRYLEPLLASGKAGWMLTGFERVSEIALAIAYVISVTYYLNLFGAFLFRSANIIDPLYGRMAASGVILLIALIGAARGLTGLERLELFSVSLKLAVIGGLIAGLAIANANLSGLPFDTWPTGHFDGWQTMRIGLGLVLLVQGFETSRYLGHGYSAELRVTSMRHAQWLSTAIYVIFIALALRYLEPLSHNGMPAGSETAIMVQLAPLSVAVLPLLTLAALASQFSAAIADAGGGGGLIAELSGGRIGEKAGYALLCTLALALTWQANIYEIIAYASRAFAGYYMLQASAACVLARRRGDRVRILAHGAAALLGLMVMIFGLAAEGG